MDLGLPVPSYQTVIALGALGFVLLVVQMLIGYRKIKFKGRLHLKVHKAMGWVILVIAIIHGFTGLLMVGILR